MFLRLRKKIKKTSPVRLIVISFVPLFDAGRVIAVLDIDSERLAAFDDTDRHYLEQICRMIEQNIS